MRKSANMQVETWNNKDIKVGAKLCGYYVRKQKFTSRQYGEGTIHVIVKDDDNTEVGLLSTAAIERLMLNVPMGSKVWVVYQGEVKSANGRNVKTYEIYFDDEDKLDLDNYIRGQVKPVDEPAAPAAPVAPAAPAA